MLTVSNIVFIVCMQVLKHKFTLTDADEYVLKHMEANAELFPIATIQSLQKKHGKLNTT